MARSSTTFDSETAKEAGEKSKRKSIDKKMQEFLDEAIKEGDERSREDILRDALFKYGLKGNIRAITELLDRAYGKPKEKVEHSGSINRPPAIININGKIIDK